MILKKNFFFKKVIGNEVSCEQNWKFKQAWGLMLYCAEQELPAKCQIFLPPRGYMESEGF